MNVIIFEDDADFIQVLKTIISEMGHTVVLCTSQIIDIKNNLMFSDLAEVYLLDMYINDTADGLSAFDLIRENSRQNLCIFITNFYDAVIYNPEIKIHAFSHIDKSNIKELPITLKMAEKEIYDKNLFIYHSKYHRISVSLSGIIFIESKDGGIAHIYHEEGLFMIRISLNRLLKDLNEDFVLCHRSFIINTRKIIRIDKNTKQIILKNGFICPYSKHRIKTWL
jgi:two-component system response regulator ComE